MLEIRTAFPFVRMVAGQRSEVVFWTATSIVSRHLGRAGGGLSLAMPFVPSSKLATNSDARVPCGDALCS